MLTTYLHGFISKFIIVEDDLEEPGDKLFKHLINTALASKTSIIYWQFNFDLIKNIPDINLISVHYDFTKLDAVNARKTAEEAATVPNNTILIIDSLALMIHKLGGQQTYRILGKIVEVPEFKQILTQLHSDLLLNNDEVIQHCSTLASLHIKIEQQFNGAQRLSYLYKKGRGKVVREIEEFSFTEDKLITKHAPKIDVKTLLQEGNPSIDSLTTFKIELNERDKTNKNNMDLPFLPKDLQSHANVANTGEIHYVFDARDDWDVEDPDDDLDI